MFDIEKNIAIREPRSRQLIYPLDDMAVGDSFFVPHASQNNLTDVIRTRRVTRGWDRLFTTRKEPGGVRVWNLPRMARWRRPPGGQQPDHPHRPGDAYGAAGNARPGDLRRPVQRGDIGH